MHAMMAFVGSGREAAARGMMDVLVQRIDQGGTNAAMTRDIGLPVCRAIQAFGRGNYRVAVEELMPVREIAHRFGGSHAQRDVIDWTLTEAAVRGGLGPLAEALAHERLALKPHSFLNRAFLRRARGGPAAPAAAP